MERAGQGEGSREDEGGGAGRKGQQGAGRAKKGGGAGRGGQRGVGGGYRGGGVGGRVGVKPQKKQKNSKVQKTKADK